MGCGSSGLKNLDETPTSVHHFNVERVLGKGAFGKVKAVVKKVHDDKNTWYAMKYLSKLQIAKAGKESSEVEQIFNELKFMKAIGAAKYRYVVNIHYAFQDDLTCYLVSDLALGGDMRYNLNKVWSKEFPKGMPEKYAKTYCAQITCALQFLHLHNILHRDIKPENVLIDTDGMLKLADFGISSFLDEKLQSYKRSGTREYMAPEISSTADHAHGTDSDYFCVGVMLYEMLLYKRPTYWEGKFLQRVDKNMVKKQLTKVNVSEECIEMCIGMMEVRRDQRIGYGLGLQGNGDELLAHSWYADIDMEATRTGNAPVHFFPNTKQANVEGGNDIVEQFGLEKEASTRLNKAQQQLFDGFHYDKLNEDLPAESKPPGSESPAAAAPAKVEEAKPAEEKPAK